MGHHFQRMQTYQESIWRKIEHSSLMPYAIGKYSGTSMIDNKAFSCSLDIRESTLTGNFSCSNNGILDSIVKNIKSLGYAVEKIETGYAIS